MAAAVASQKEPKFRWGELEDEDGCGGDVDLSHLLPTRVVVGPDADGLRKVIEYRFDDGGNKVKVTTTTRTRSLARARLSRSAVERRSWTKFGDASECGDAGSHLTMVSTEEVHLERPRAPGKRADEPTCGDPLDMATPKSTLLMVCRTCGKKGDHWTSKCPYKDLASQTESFDNRPSTADGLAAPGGTGGRTYVPPNKKEGADASGPSMMRRNENSIRVNNLSEHTLEPDLLDLFHPFGPVSRVYIATDRKTG
ncbi:hypothetical protein U9M48_033492 [Paspalum notatum var. saurae]|uniref:RRM domain-containing protein n=1 Tax=Paspalum notatum var. saurae TaxID=547442 RepID=A0AAQ3X6N6_PASNO